MPARYKSALTILFLFCTITVSAQNKINPDTLIKQASALTKQGKYDDALAKFNTVLLDNPNNYLALYEMALTLYTKKRSVEPIPYLEQVIRDTKDDKLKASAHNLLGNIFDFDHQQQKALENFDATIKLDPNYPQIYFNKALSYLNNQQYDLAEVTVIEAIKRNPKFATNYAIYGLATYKQNKRVAALMSYCTFISFESATQRSTSAYQSILGILKGGVATQDGKTTIQISPTDSQETSTLNMSLSLVALSSQQKKLEGADLLADELTTLFNITGELSEKKTNKNFFDTFFADYFYKLAKTEYMPAFAHLLALSSDRDAAAKWGQTNLTQITAMAHWLQDTPHAF